MSVAAYPRLWRDVTAARRDERARLGDQSREQRAAGDVYLWVGELIAALDIVASAAGAGTEPETWDDVDPVDALVELVAVAAAWHDAMDTGS